MPAPSVIQVVGLTRGAGGARCYYPNTNAVIYVVDSADQERVSVCKVGTTCKEYEAERVGASCNALAWLRGCEYGCGFGFGFAKQRGVAAGKRKLMLSGRRRTSY